MDIGEEEVPAVHRAGQSLSPEQDKKNDATAWKPGELRPSA